MKPKTVFKQNLNFFLGHEFLSKGQCAASFCADQKQSVACDEEYLFVAFGFSPKI